MKAMIDADSDYDSKNYMKSIQEKLIEIYQEEACKNLSLEALNSSSGLLSILIEREHLNTLIVNLYPGNEGYSLMLRNASTSEEIETVRLAYEEADILDCINHELIPPVIIDLLDRVQNNLFYSGCILAEIRDYRHLTDNLFETHYVLLKPSNHTLLCDLNSITSETKKWSVKEKLMLESEMLLHTSDQLCLDPSPSVFNVALRASRHKTLLHSSLRKTIKRCSQAFLNHCKKLKSRSQQFALREYFLQHGINKSKNEKFPITKIDIKSESQKSEIIQAAVQDPDVFKYAQAIDQPKMTADNSLLFVEEFTFEADRGNGKTNLSKLTILRRLSDEVYFGCLYVDRDFKEGESQGSSCRFNLGSYTNVEKYVRQFREIFTEEGRRQVKITHRVGSYPPVITFTRVSNDSSATTNSNLTSRLINNNDDDNSLIGSDKPSSHPSIEIETKKPSSVILTNTFNSPGSSSQVASLQSPNINMQTAWNVEPLLSSPNQVTPLFPINKLLPAVNPPNFQAPVTLANMSVASQLSRLFTPGNINSGLLQINTSQLGCPSILLSPPLDNTKPLGVRANVSQFFTSKTSLCSPLNVRPVNQPFLPSPPSLNLQSSNVVQLPSQYVPQQLQQKPSSNQQLQQQQQQLQHQQLQQQQQLQQIQQQCLQQRSSQLLSQLKEVNKNK